MKNFTITLLATTSLLLASCASNPPIEERRLALSSAKTIAIVSTGAKGLGIDYLGFTIFNNVKQVVDVSSWGMEKKIVDEVIKGLNGRFDVVLTETWPELEPVNYSSAKDRGLRADLGEQVLQPYVEKALQRKPVDLVLFILPRGQPMLNVVSGRPGLDGDSVVVPVTLTVYDAKTKREIYGTIPSNKCEVVRFNFKASDLNAEVARNRAILEQASLRCFSTHFTKFSRAAGL
jgi:hypothetical protein